MLKITQIYEKLVKENKGDFTLINKLTLVRDYTILG